MVTLDCTEHTTREINRTLADLAAGEEVTPIAYEDFAREVDRFEHAQRRIRVPEGGNYV